MNENFSDNNQPMSPVLDATQRQVLDALRAKETDECPLGDWYLGALYALHNKYNPDRFAQAAQSLRELLEKLPKVFHESDVIRPHNFKEIRKNINRRWIKDKKRYDGKWKGETVTTHFDETLRAIDRYLELNQMADRRVPIQSAIRQIDPMADIFDPKIQKEKDNRFREIWTKLQSFAHHGSNPDEQRFMACFSAIDQIIFDLLAPITAQNQQEIRSILEKSAPTEDDINSMLKLITRRGANYRFFFAHVEDGVWLEPLRSNGYFDNSPDSEETSDGGYQAPFWQPISYLIHVYETKPEEVLEILENLPKTSNPHILEGIMDVVLKSDSVEVTNRLSSRILSFLDHAIWGHNKIIELLKKPFLFDRKLAEFTSAFLRKVVGLVPDPKSRTTRLEPSPHFNQWEYQQILENGIRPLCEKEPYPIARILIDAIASLIRLSRHQGYLNREEDSSEIWCPRLNQSNQDYLNTKELLVHTLTFACEKVYEKSPESIEKLDQILRNQRWKIFKRLRQHLYSLNPNEQTLPWIREFILEHKDYAKWEHHYEFQLMIRKACEHFGASLLSEEERTEIFEAILSGPSKENYREKMSDQFAEEGFQQWQQNFHRRQLRPFARLLTGEYQNYFQELEDASDEDPPNDEDYSPVGQVEGGTVSYRSPRSPEGLTKFDDEKLLTYINDWQEVRPWYEENRYEDDQWIEINIGALADAFKTVFKDAIISDEKRLTFWLENRDGIERPVYIRAIVLAIQEHVKEQHYERLDLWFEFCEWVLSHPDAERDHGERGDESREHPDWGSSRRAVGDFIGECLKEKTSVPFTARESLANILKQLCTQFDRRLDLDEPVLLNRNDQITEAINNTRSRALEDLVKFGLWVRRHDDMDNVPEITSILEERFKDDAEFLLKMPERAQLGRYYGQLWSLNHTWAIKHKAVFFPQDNLPVWIEAFGGFLAFNSPFKPIFEILRDDFTLALDHLGELKEIAQLGQNLTDKLSQHLFTYYLWKVYPLNTEDSLLEKFYEKTTEDRQRWAHLFDYVGRSLSNSGKHLEEDLRDRIFAFFDWRLEQKEPEELQLFSFWLEAECLDPDWRLDAYSKILDVSQPDSRSIFWGLDMLNGMLESHTAKVVECFAKITDAINHGEGFYIDADKAKPILKAGLVNEDESVRENAERARETLLNAGRYSFLDI